MFLTQNINSSTTIKLAYSDIGVISPELLRQIAMLDILCIAIGFLLRVEAGGAAFTTPVSEWLFLTVFFLALFLEAGKRLAEKNLYAPTLQHIALCSHNTAQDFLRASCL